MSRNTFEKLWALFRVLSVTKQQTQRVLKVGPPRNSEDYKKVYEVAKTWLDELKKALHCEVKAEGFKPFEEPCLYVANHVGYLDIPVLMSLTKGSFVSKKEVSTWPIFGTAAKSYGTVFLDRKNPEARKQVGETIAQYIASQKKSVILFPEGTSSEMGVEWRRGAFSIAKQYNIPVQPIRIAYNPHSVVAYWGDQTFLGHMWRMLSEEQILASVEFFEPRFIQRVEEDAIAMQIQVQNSLRKKLESWQGISLRP